MPNTHETLHLIPSTGKETVLRPLMILNGKGRSLESMFREHTGCATHCCSPSLLLLGGKSSLCFSENQNLSKIYPFASFLMCSHMQSCYFSEYVEGSQRISKRIPQRGNANDLHLGKNSLCDTTFQDDPRFPTSISWCIPPEYCLPRV